MRSKNLKRNKSLKMATPYKCMLAANKIEDQLDKYFAATEKQSILIV